jgi:hypothetical protein
MLREMLSVDHEFSMKIHFTKLKGKFDISTPQNPFSSQPISKSRISQANTMGCGVRILLK